MIFTTVLSASTAHSKPEDSNLHVAQNMRILLTVLLSACQEQQQDVSMCCGAAAGFHAAIGTFFIFYLISIATMLQMSAVYRLLASASPNTDIGTAAGNSKTF